jgi:hypothetical protein
VGIDNIVRVAEDERKRDYDDECTVNKLVL